MIHSINKPLTIPSKRRGIAVFALISMITTAVMFIVLFSQNFLSGVNSQRETIFVGREAMHLAESAINETLLDFKAGMNDPSGSLTEWHNLLRQSLESNEMIETSFYPYFTEQNCETGIEVSIEDVKVNIWALKPLTNNQYDRCGLLTITAVVAIKRKNGGLLNRYIYRNIQRSYQLKQVLITPPAPFDEWTLFMAKWGYLRKALSDYEREQQGFKKRREQSEEALQTYMDEIPPFLDPKIEKAGWALEKLEKVKDFVDKFEINLGFTKVGAGSVGWGSDDIQAGVDTALGNYNLTMADVQDIADTDAVAWMPELSFTEVTWPSFRSDSTPLSNPVYSTKSPLSGSDFPIRFPPWPVLPPDPVISPQWIYTWKFPDLGYLKTIFNNWQNQYNSVVPGPYQSKWSSELSRHEGMFPLLPSMPPEYEYLDKHYQYRRSSWRFKTSATFLEHITKGNKLNLNGAYWIDEPVTLTGSCLGSGSIASGWDVTINGLVSDPAGKTTIYSGGNIDLSGMIKASLVSPQGTVRFNGGSVTGMVIENYHNGDDGFLVTMDPEISPSVPLSEKVWFTVSPYMEATNLLRRSE